MGLLGCGSIIDKGDEPSGFVFRLDESDELPVFSPAFKQFPGALFGDVGDELLEPAGTVELNSDGVQLRPTEQVRGAPGDG